MYFILGGINYEKEICVYSCICSFLLVFTSISSAYKSQIQKNYVVINNDIEDIEIELLKTNIQEKINEMNDKKISFIDLIKTCYLYSSQDDPNGPILVDLMILLILKHFFGVY